MEINIEERVALAKSNFASGYNCSQSVALAFADIYNIEPELMATISASFGGGLGRLREVCGAVSGMALIANFISPAPDPANRDSKSANYKCVQHLAEQFRSENGSIICRELLSLDGTKLPTGKKKPCAELVATAARIVAESIQG